MLIEGPFKVGIIEDPNAKGAELQLDFTDDFRALSQGRLSTAIKDCVRRLQSEILAEPEESEDRQGMLMLQQVAEQLLPHIEAGELPLHESIIIELQMGSSMRRFIPSDDPVTRFINQRR